MTPTQVKVIGVQHELWQVEELGDQLLDVGHVVFGGGEPGFSDAVEHPVSQVEVPPLEIKAAPDKSFGPDMRFVDNNHVFNF